MNAFHVCGVILGLWAIAVTVIGMRSPDFPKTRQGFRAVIGISVVLVALAAGTAIFTSAVEDAEHEEEAAQHAAAEAPAEQP